MSSKSKNSGKSLKTTDENAPKVFELSTIPSDILKSPLLLREWLDAKIPYLIGPKIDSFAPVSGPRGTILTISGTHFSSVRENNEVTINGISIPVLGASSDELRVLVTDVIDSGLVRVRVGAKVNTSQTPFIVQASPIDADEGPPVFAQGIGDGVLGDVNPTGVIRVIVVICQANDLTPNAPIVRNTVNSAWQNVAKYYSQASFAKTNMQYDIATGVASLDGAFSDFVDLATLKNIRPNQLNRIAAFAARQAQNDGFDLNNYQMLCALVYTNGSFIRAWGGGEIQTFFYDNGLPINNPARININISLGQRINLLWINEAADWGRFAHEFGHNIVSAPTSNGDGSATLGEDVYGSDLVDPTAATAQQFELMGNHDFRPLLSGYHLEKLGYYNSSNIRVLSWNRTPHNEEIDVIAHGLTENTNASRVHMVKIKVSDALSYYVEVRQRPGTTAQVFDSLIPVGASAPNQGGVIVTRVIAGEMHNNQQTRFITLMHNESVQLSGDFIDDPLRALRITVISDNIQARPQVCRVRVEWAQTMANNPNGAFDLSITPMNGNGESPDIWIDRDPNLGEFDNPIDAQGRPSGTGDKPWLNHVNKFFARINVSGAMGASNVKVTFYSVYPPGVGDNGNWSPVGFKIIPSIGESSHFDVACNWVPVVGRHTCLRAYASYQPGEISGGNNGAQENVFDFKAAGSSPAAPLFIRTAIRNPLEERRRIHLTLTGLPAGWAGHLPYAWLWLDGLAEREVDVLVWPTFDVNLYRFGSNDPERGRLPGLAEVRVKGYMERSYSELMDRENHRFGSRFYFIGGTLYRVSVARRASLQLIIESIGDANDKIAVEGLVSPTLASQRILIDLKLPDGKTHRTAQLLSDVNGRYSTVMSLLDDTAQLQPGYYQVQAFIHNALDLDDVESSIVTIVR